MKYWNTNEIIFTNLGNQLCKVQVFKKIGHMILFSAMSFCEGNILALTHEQVQLFITKNLN